MSFSSFSINLDSRSSEPYIECMFVKNAICFLLLTAAYPTLAIEGQQPTPQFIPPDFSVKEERETYPGDLIEFFQKPFIDYLQFDYEGKSYRPIARVSSEQEFIGGFRFNMPGVFAYIQGEQRYFDHGNMKEMLREIDGRAGYALMLADRYPVGVKLDAGYDYFRGHYEPYTYNIKGSAEAHLPLGPYLISASALGIRESWIQRPGPYSVPDPPDRERQEISNAMGGNLTFRGMFNEFTGFDLGGSGTSCTRYRTDFWEREYLVYSGHAALIFDSQPLRIAIGSMGHKTYEETVLSPLLNFHLVGERFYTRAILTSSAEVPIRPNFHLPPRVALPKNSDYFVTPMSVMAEGRIELKPDQFLFGKVDYANTRGEPVVMEPLAEAPCAVMSDVAHQSFFVSLSNDFGFFDNILSMRISSDEIDDMQIPTGPIRVIADTFTVDFGNGIGIWAAGERVHLPEISEKEINDIGVGVNYKYDRFEFALSFGNILRNNIFDMTALTFSNEVRVWGGITADF